MLDKRPEVEVAEAAARNQGRPAGRGVGGLLELNRLAAGLVAFLMGATEARCIVAPNHNHLPSWGIDIVLLQADCSAKWDEGTLLFSRLMEADKRVAWRLGFRRAHR